MENNEKIVRERNRIFYLIFCVFLLLIFHFKRNDLAQMLKAISVLLQIWSLVTILISLYSRLKRSNVIPFKREISWLKNKYNWIKSKLGFRNNDNIYTKTGNISLKGNRATITFHMDINSFDETKKYIDMKVHELKEEMKILKADLDNDIEHVFKTAKEDVAEVNEKIGNIGNLLIPKYSYDADIEILAILALILGIFMGAYYEEIAKLLC